MIRMCHLPPPYQTLGSDVLKLPVTDGNKLSEYLLQDKLSGGHATLAVPQRRTGAHLRRGHW